MKIRFATLEDIPTLVEMGRTFHELTRFRVYDYNAEQATANLRAIIENPRGAGVKLLTAFKKWAENRGVYELSVGINSGTDLPQMDSFLRKLGFQQTGGNYSMLLGGGE